MLEILLHRLFGIGEPSGSVRGAWGIAAHTAAVMIAFLTAVGAIAWGLRDNPALVAVVLIVSAVVVLFLFGTWCFAYARPDQAGIGGRDLALLRQAELDSKYGLAPSPSTTDPDKTSKPDKQLAAPPKLLDPPDAE